MSHFIHSCFRRNTAGRGSKRTNQRLLPPSPDLTSGLAVCVATGTGRAPQLEEPQESRPQDLPFPPSKNPATEVPCFLKNFLNNRTQMMCIS